jgi:hypothetical protein
LPKKGGLTEAELRRKAEPITTPWIGHFGSEEPHAAVLRSER